MGLYKGIIDKLKTAGRNVSEMASDPAKAKAFTSKHFGKTGIGKRVAVAAGYAGAYGIGSTALDFFEEEKRAYLGEERYQGYYGSGVGALKFMGGAAATILGGGAIFGKDPISRLVRETKYRGYQVLDFLTPALSGPKRQMISARRSFSQTFKPTAARPGETAEQAMARRQADYARYKTEKEAFLDENLSERVTAKIPLSRAERRRIGRGVTVGSVPPGELRGTMSNNMNLIPGLQKYLPEGVMPVTPGPARRTIRNTEFADYRQVKRGDVMQLKKTTRRAIDQGPMTQSEIAAKNKETLEYNKSLLDTKREIAEKIKRYETSPRVNQAFILRAAVMAKGGSFLRYATQEGGELGDYAVMGLLGAIPAGIIGYGAGSAIRQNPVSTLTAMGIASAAGFATYASVNRLSDALPAEGNIIDLSMANAGGGVSKMNFSTAGLVQALHKANRRY